MELLPANRNLTRNFKQTRGQLTRHKYLRLHRPLLLTMHGHYTRFPATNLSYLQSSDKIICPVVFWNHFTRTDTRHGLLVLCCVTLYVTSPPFPTYARETRNDHLLLWRTSLTLRTHSCSRYFNGKSKRKILFIYLFNLFGQWSNS